MKQKEIKPVLSKITRGAKRVKKKAKAHGMGSITEGETCSAFGGEMLHSKTGRFKATMSVTHLPYFLQPFSLDHLQDLLMAHGCVGVFLQNLKEHNKMSKNVSSILCKCQNTLLLK